MKEKMIGLLKAWGNTFYPETTQRVLLVSQNTEYERKLR